ncbi:hypothetical protein FS749_006075 [Ceratobasidium sp. UAMH 11750]|nr:hypothetical protein FS749_006075 [Ceratobasidium sp. UAMH 11750]
MLFFVPLLAVTTLLQTIIPGVPVPESFVPVNAAARGTDVSLWILQQCPSPTTTLAELELALQIGSSDALIYTAPIGLYAWRSSPTLRAWGRTLVANVDHLLSTSRVKLDSYRRSTRHTRAPGHDTFPNGTSARWYTDDDRRRVYLAVAMARIGLLSPSVLTLPAPPLVLSLPAPAPILSLQAPRPILTLPAPAPMLALPAPPPVLSITVPASAMTSPVPKSTRTLPTPKSIFTQPPVTASPISHLLPTPSAPNFEGHARASPRPVPLCTPTSVASMAPSPPASKVSAATFTPVRGIYPVVTKPIVHTTIRKWHNHLSMACLVLLTLGYNLAASRSFEGLVRRSVVGANYPSDDGERDGFGHALDPFGQITIDIFDTTRSRTLGGLAPDLFRFCAQPGPVGVAFGDGISGEHGELEQALDPFGKLAIDTFNVVRSGRLSGLAPDLFRFCDQPELPDAALEDILEQPLESREGTDGEGTQQGLSISEGARVEAEETEPARETDGVTASSDIPVDGTSPGLPEDMPGLDDTPGRRVGGDAVAANNSVDIQGAVDGQLEPGPEGAFDKGTGVEAQGGEGQVDTADDSVGDSSRGLEEPYRPGRFAWSDEAEALELDDARSTADSTSRAMDLQTRLELSQPEPGPSSVEPGRGGAQVGGTGTSSSRWAPQGEGIWRGGYRGGQGSGSRGGWGGGSQSRGGWNGGRGGGYSGGRGAYSSGGRGGYGGGGGGYSGGRGGYGARGNGGGNYRGGGSGSSDSRNGERRESKASYFFRLRNERKDALREAARN